MTDRLLTGKQVEQVARRSTTPPARNEMFIGQRRNQEARSGLGVSVTGTHASLRGFFTLLSTTNADKDGEYLGLHSITAVARNCPLDNER
jgi:hypothetical protein